MNNSSINIYDIKPMSLNNLLDVDINYISSRLNSNYLNHKEELVSFLISIFDHVDYLSILGNSKKLNSSDIKEFMQGILKNISLKKDGSFCGDKKSFNYLEYDIVSIYQKRRKTPSFRLGI